MQPELKITYFTVGIHDPITKEPLKSPVRSYYCNLHDAFEESTILSLIEAEGEPLRCPLCQAPITKDSLTNDFELMDFIEANKPIGDRQVAFHIETSDYVFLDQITGSKDQNDQIEAKIFNQEEKSEDHDS